MFSNNSLQLIDLSMQNKIYERKVGFSVIFQFIYSSHQFVRRKTKTIFIFKIMFSVAETIENGTLMVTSCRSIWIEENILYWPPGVVDIRKNVPRQPDWTPHMCKVLKENIGN